MSKEITATSVARLKDGLHTGIICDVTDRETPKGYDYTDVWIDSEESKIKTSYPSAINERSGLGKLLVRLGVPVLVGKNYIVSDLILNKKVTFQTNDDGEFVNVIKGTEKLVEDEVKI